MQKGFTAVEVMISLIIAVIFLFSGYQLYLVVNDSLMVSRNRADASNLAYVYLKKRSDSTDMSMCSHAIKNFEETLSEEESNLNSVKVSTTINFLYGCNQKLIEISSIVEYKLNNTKQTEKQVIYVEK